MLHDANEFFVSSFFFFDSVANMIKGKTPEEIRKVYLRFMFKVHLLIMSFVRPSTSRMTLHPKRKRQFAKKTVGLKSSNCVNEENLHQSTPMLLI